MPLTSPERRDSSRTESAACARVRSVTALRKRIASKRFDFPTPFAPAMHVKGPKRTSTSTKFLKPETLKLVSLAQLYHLRSLHAAVFSQVFSSPILALN